MLFGLVSGSPSTAVCVCNDDTIAGLASFDGSPNINVHKFYFVSCVIKNNVMRK